MIFYKKYARVVIRLFTSRDKTSEEGELQSFMVKIRVRPLELDHSAQSFEFIGESLTINSMWTYRPPSQKTTQFVDEFGSLLEFLAFLLVSLAFLLHGSPRIWTEGGSIGGATSTPTPLFYGFSQDSRLSFIVHSSQFSYARDC